MIRNVIIISFINNINIIIITNIIEENYKTL